MGESQFNFSMPPENRYYAPVQTSRKPMHRKSRPSTAVVAVASLLGGVLATTGVAFALLPAVAGATVNEAFGEVPPTSSSQVTQAKQELAPADETVKTVPAVAKGDQVKGAKQATLANAEMSAYPVHRLASAEVEATEEEPVEVAAEAAVEVAAAVEDQRTWVEGWTETIVHPAVYDDIPNYDSYLCVECGYESLDQSDIVAHIDSHGGGDYLTVDNDCPKVVLEEEWTEEIHHEGHWE